MSDSLRTSVEKLKNSTARLNKVADDAAQVVQTVETFLSKECGVGVEMFALVSSFPVLDDDGNPYNAELRNYLGYSRHSGKFRIVVSVGVSPDDEEVKPWAECDRETKLETVKKLPELLDKIAAAVEERAAAAHAATATVLEVLKAVNPAKGAK